MTPKRDNGLNFPQRDECGYEMLHATVKLVQQACGDKFAEVMLGTICILHDNKGISIERAIGISMVDHKITTKLSSLI